MVYDLNMLKSFYASYKGKMEHVRAALKRPLTLAEKILYTHLYNVADLKIMKGVKTMSTFARPRCYAGCYCSDGSVAIYECG